MTNKKMNMLEIERTTCPICSRKLTIFNSSLNKVEGRRICGSCSGKLSRALPGRLSYKDMTTLEAIDCIRNYDMDFSKRNAVSSQPSEPKPQKIPRRAQCPKCHGTNIVPIGQKHKNFATGRAVVGSTLINPVVGIGVGLLGKSSKKVQFYCQDCGKQFMR